ncbi:hypothetical protein LEN26_010880 [Aphanomyces euteiches]|uniref:Protein kinase domain-containing protein n=1 Tax=Aphanomyces euteiches TaxID=100861 RepID=A0A6G0WIV8_9STRA|nr:hypothetical protein Ae201684_014706 [Aphanomyces euteiches]KAH9078782.1 hypothetical protein Ae201684P_019856 [Aphanomyces euteiches]KAH9120973.1 hypothetical protein LEN26_010880 [Aphanomyces euteiches]KAH9153110.1 hypothetical protein AeRB84_004579 [Aphanomyces euteiches]
MGQCRSRDALPDPAALTAVPRRPVAARNESGRPVGSSAAVTGANTSSAMESVVPIMEQSISTTISPTQVSPPRRTRREPSMNRPIRSSGVRRMFGQLKKFTRDVTVDSFDNSPDKFVTFHSYDYVELRAYEAEHWIEPDAIKVEALIPSSSMITERGVYKGTPVFLKRLNKNASSYKLSRSRRLLVAEVKLSSRLRHPHIVQFLGFTVTSATGLVCVSEYIAGPSLQRLLATPLLELSWSNAKMHYAVDLAAALVYMHALSPQVLHGNIKSDHLYITQENLLKVAGFGFSMQDSLTHKSQNEWNAPEVLQGLPMTQKVDVYSMGIVLMELDTRKLPFLEERKSMKYLELLLRITTGTIRPQLSPECPPQLREIIEACIQYPPSKRPNAEWVFSQLKQVQSELNSPVANATTSSPP